jgi:hypothetical protein
MKTLKDYKNFLNESSNIGYVVVGYNNNYKDYIYYINVEDGVTFCPIIKLGTSDVTEQKIFYDKKFAQRIKKEQETDRFDVRWFVEKAK